MTIDRGNIRRRDMKREIFVVLSALVLVVSLVSVITPSAGVGAAIHTDVFTTSGTFVVPAGVTSVDVLVVACTRP